MRNRGRANYKHPRTIKIPPMSGPYCHDLLIFLKGKQLVSIADIVLERCLGEPLDGRKVWMKIYWKPQRIALVLWPWFRQPTDPKEPDTFSLWRQAHRNTKHHMYFYGPHLRELLGIDNTQPAVGYPLHVSGGRIHVNIRRCFTSVLKKDREVVV